jgi:hypothetical protein
MTIRRSLSFAFDSIAEFDVILDELTDLDARILALGGTPSGKVFNYEQPTDPGAVGAGKWWADTTPDAERVGRRNDANTAWVFFSSSAVFVTDNNGDHLLDQNGDEVTL